MKRPDSEPHTVSRYDEPYYTSIVTTTPGVTPSDRKRIYFFRDNDEPTGWYRYEQTIYDWYISTAIEKLNKLPAIEQAEIDRVLVFDLRQAIRQKYQRGGSKELDLPTCKNSRKAVESWIKRTFDAWGDNPDA